MKINAISKFLGVFICSYITSTSYSYASEQIDITKKVLSSETRFLFTSDPQFYTGRSDINDPTLDKLAGIIKELTYSQKTPRPIFGLLVGGDMTQTAHDKSITGWEFGFWKEIIKYYDVENKAYETIGNHDETTGGASAPDDIVKFIDRDREHPRLSYRRRGALYSWNVDGIHFVSLGTGVFSSDRPTVFGGVKNYNQLDFLQNDLDINVGDSNKPIVLMFHMPANHKDWNESDRKRFLNLIQEYNVVLLLTGHTHSWGGRQYITLPNGRKIPQVVAPTIRNDQKPVGQYTDIKLRSGSPWLEVELKHNDGVENYKGRIVLDLKTDEVWYPDAAPVEQPNYASKNSSFNGKAFTYKDVHYYTIQTRNGTDRCIGYDGNPSFGNPLVQVSCNESDPRQNWFWSAQTHQIHSKMDWSYCWWHGNNSNGGAIKLAKCDANDPNMRWQYSKFNRDQDWMRRIKPEGYPNLNVDGFRESRDVNLYSAHFGSTQLWGVSHQRYPANQISFSAPIPMHNDFE